MEHSRLAVIGDVHSNVLALRAALKSIHDFEVNSSPIDAIVFVGDLLTYGVRPSETIEELHRLRSSRRSFFVLGNHDLMYLELISNSLSDDYNKLPLWIKESINLNLQRFDPLSFLELDFYNFFSRGSTLVSHANFSSLFLKVPNWSYVNTAEEHKAQLLGLHERGFHLGLLGHTHRIRHFTLQLSDAQSKTVQFFRSPLSLDTPICLKSTTCSLLNAGSIGQPRDSSQELPSWLLIELDGLKASSATFVSFGYDTSAHLEDIFSSPLSAYCKTKLSSYFT